PESHQQGREDDPADRPMLHRGSLVTPDGLRPAKGSVLPAASRHQSTHPRVGGPTLTSHAPPSFPACSQQPGVTFEGTSRNETRNTRREVATTSTAFRLDNRAPVAIRLPTLVPANSAP